MELEQQVEQIRQQLADAQAVVGQREAAVVQLQQQLAQERAAHNETQRQLAAVYQSLEVSASHDRMPAVRSGGAAPVFSSDPNDSTQTVDSSWLEAELKHLNDT